MKKFKIATDTQNSKEVENDKSKNNFCRNSSKDY